MFFQITLCFENWAMIKPSKAEMINFPNGKNELRWANLIEVERKIPAGKMLHKKWERIGFIQYSDNICLSQLLLIVQTHEKYTINICRVSTNSALPVEWSFLLKDPEIFSNLALCLWIYNYKNAYVHTNNEIILKMSSDFEISIDLDFMLSVCQTAGMLMLMYCFPLQGIVLKWAGRQYIIWRKRSCDQLPVWTSTCCQRFISHQHTGSIQRH